MSCGSSRTRRARTRGRAADHRERRTLRKSRSITPPSTSTALPDVRDPNIRIAPATTGPVASPKEESQQQPANSPMPRPLPSYSIHLRRFCRIALTERVPDESTVRKLTRRLGAETVHELTRELIAKARREKRFRPRAARIDSTVVEADVRWPTDADLAAHGVRALAREGRKLAARIGKKRTSVRDRSRSMGRKLRALTRTIRRRTGEAKREVLVLTEQTGQLLGASIKEARKLAATARRHARGRGAKAKLKAATRLEELADRCEKVSSQIRQRVNGEPIKDRLMSLCDSGARPIRKGKLGKPTSSGTSISSARSPRTRSAARAG